MPREYSRTLRVADTIWHTLATRLQKEVKDPRLAKVTITHVVVSKDLAYAKIYFTLLDPTQTAETLKALRKAKGFLRYQLAEALDLRVVPDLSFFYDESIARGARLTRLIDQAAGKERKS